MKVGIMATQNPRQKITVDKIGAFILLYIFTCLGLWLITGNGSYLWSSFLAYPMVMYDAHKRPEKFATGSIGKPLPFYQDPYLVNVGIGGTAANEVYKLNLEIQQLRQELERMKYK
jgi:hypothetical protein